jgi:hypothetical protein
VWSLPLADDGMRRTAGPGFSPCLTISLIGRQQRSGSGLTKFQIDRQIAVIASDRPTTAVLLQIRSKGYPTFAIVTKRHQRRVGKVICIPRWCVF